MKHPPLLLLLLLAAALPAQMRLRDVAATPHWPWDGKVDILFHVEGGEEGDYARISFWEYDPLLQRETPVANLTGRGVGEWLPSGGPYLAEWDFAAQHPGEYRPGTTVRGQVDATLPNPYWVVNLETGAIRTTGTPPAQDDDIARTTELWLRRIPAGTFLMGSPQEEAGRNDGEVLRQVTLTRDFYIGIFEVTQRQYELLTGERPSYFLHEASYATRPVERLSYQMIRGAVAGAGWPASHEVDPDSFLGKLRAKTGIDFDLPTEAQWEYACRAGTTTALNTGDNLTAPGKDPAMDQAGRYLHNGGSPFHENADASHGTARVGSYLPNAWGLYDMHGNVWEWCLDWVTPQTADAATDPTGADSGTDRVVRGGGWDYAAQDCRSANRDSDGCGRPPEGGDYDGFRVLCLP
ncbi:MAG: formylglycine-generating enzyme family protein [Oligosphaeraceae bacterium]